MIIRSAAPCPFAARDDSCLVGLLFSSLHLLSLSLSIEFVAQCGSYREQVRECVSIKVRYRFTGRAQ